MPKLAMLEILLPHDIQITWNHMISSHQSTVHSIIYGLQGHSVVMLVEEQCHRRQSFLGTIGSVKEDMHAVASS